MLFTHNTYLETRTGIARPKGDTPGKGRPEIVNPGASWKAVATLRTAARPDSGEIRRLRENIRTIEDGIVHSDLYDAFLKTVCLPIQGTPGAEYLEDRGIAVDVADRYGIRFCSDLSGLWTLADRKKIKAARLSSLYVFQKAGLPFLAFPYIRRGRPVFIKEIMSLPLRVSLSSQELLRSSVRMSIKAKLIRPKYKPIQKVTR